MCKTKSGLLLKDRVFVPNHYNSHTQMLEELKISDDNPHRKTTFARFEVSPKNGDNFSNITDWEYNLDQDILPEWYVTEVDEQRARKTINQWANRYDNKRTLSDIAIGGIFRIGNLDYVVLNKNNNTASCLSVDFVNDNKRFDSNTNKFDKSEIKQYLNGAYFDLLKSEVGADNVVGDISLLTLDQYDKYRNVITTAEKWWWLADKYEGTSYGVCVVGSGGGVYGYSCDCGGCGVRAFCIFKSNILVSCE